MSKIETLAKKRVAEAKSDYDARLKFPDEYAMNLAYGRRTKGSGSAAWRSNFFYPTIPSTIRTYIPRLLDGLIGPDGTDFFDLEADSEMDSNDINTKVSADIIKAIQNKHYGDEGMFYNVQSQIEHNVCVFGRGYSIIGWEDYTEEYDYFRTQGNKLFKEHVKKRVNRPTRYCPNSTDIWVDPAASNWEKKTFVIERQFKRLSQLKAEALRWNQRERFNDVLKMIEKQISADYANTRQNANSNNPTASSNIDPIQTLFVIYEKGAITTLWMNYVIRYVETPFAHGNIPVYNYTFENDFYRYNPKGLSLILCDINEAQNAALNIMFDSWLISTIPTFKQRRTSFIDTQDKVWEPGKIMMVDDMKDLEELLKTHPNVESAMILEKLAGIANQASGSMDYMNAPTGVANVNKTYGGARMIKQEANQAMAKIIKHQKETGLKPELQDTLMNYYQFLDEETVEEILGKKRAVQLNYTKGFKIAWDAKWKYKLSGDISLVDKQTKLDNIEQAVQLFTGLYTSMQQGIPINPAPIVKQILDTLGVDKSLLAVAPKPLPAAQPANPPGPAAGQTPPPSGSAAANPANIAAPSTAATQPAPHGDGAPLQPPSTALTPEQIQILPQIAQALQIAPEQLEADLNKGIIPGGFETLLHLMKLNNPKLWDVFKKRLASVETKTE